MPGMAAALVSAEATTMTDPTTLAELAVAHPAAARVFYANRLDFCCGGRRPFAEACRERGLDANAVLDEILREESSSEPATRWELAPLQLLVDRIVNHYHRRLRVALPNLIRMARRVEERHGDKGSCPIGLAALLEQVHTSVLDHLEKEETILFPALLRHTGTELSRPVYVLESEHEHHRSDLQRIRALTNDLTVPDEACTTWRALYGNLQQLEQELMEHIHLENNILFRRALAA
jgi:regulator of cell morphogenesis and NO signaling